MTAHAVAGIQQEHRRSVLAWLHLARIYARLEHAHQVLLAEFGLSPAQFDVLSHLATAPGLSQTALADRLLVTKGNVCGLIDRLERGGLVERRPDPSDRRSNQLYLTDAGRARFEAAAPVLEEAIARHFDGLSQSELTQVVRLLGRVERDLRDREEL